MPGYTEREAREAVAVSFSYAETLRRLGLRAAGGNAPLLRKWLERWRISTDHFDPCARSRGPRRSRIALEAILIEHSTYPRAKLKRRIYDEGLKVRRCELCGQGELWRDRTMSLILDHINGVHDDNRLENLRIVCPNCAATLDTHCGRKNRAPIAARLCRRCGEEFTPNDRRQRYCSPYCGLRHARPIAPKPALRRVERPPYEQLLREIAETSYVAVGRKYGVSDNAIRKWVRQYERELGLLSEVAAGPEALREVAAAGSSSARVGRRAR
jgi:transposase-like protein